ncbi:hypothetical protein BC831DRAFT_442118 [Entophlyctis helioformis]|nr:hypothetical protein BC831DRAFT_442118 [Entophlyctis helioformis]
MLKVTFMARTLNRFTVCGICHGIIIDAATINECLHSFCKACIYKHCGSPNAECPTCSISLGAQPLEMVRLDPTLQSIINKVTPNLEERIKGQRLEFEGALSPVMLQSQPGSAPGSPTRQTRSPQVHAPGSPRSPRSSKRQAHSHPLESPGSSPTAQSRSPTQGSPKRLKMDASPRPSSQADSQPDGIIVFLVEPDTEWASEQRLPANLPVITITAFKCKSHSSIKTIKRHLVRKLSKPSQPNLQLDLVYHNKILGEEWTIEYVSRTLWADKTRPMTFKYRVRLE